MIHSIYIFRISSQKSNVFIKLEDLAQARQNKKGTKMLQPSSNPQS